MKFQEFPLAFLRLWIDPIPRSGPENMAIDEWLLETCDSSILRVYGWQGCWKSVGCFERLNHLNETRGFVRRMTGGGTVDHQSDWTYSFVIPATENLSKLKGSGSYEMIHTMLVSVLSNQLKLTLVEDQSPSFGGDCFTQPVGFDVIDLSGRKIAGAGQRRTKFGLLHQGSIALPCNTLDSIDRSKRLASMMAAKWEMVDLDPPAEVVREKVLGRYGNTEWTTRR